MEKGEIPVMKMELQPWTQALAGRMAVICDQCDQTYLSGHLPSPYTLEDAQKWLERIAQQEGTQCISRAIVVDGQAVGTISVDCEKTPSHRNANLGYMLLTPWWGRGIMTWAVEQICALAFEQLDLLRITAIVYHPNLASCRVLEKNGFVLEGVCRQAVYKGEAVYDKKIYGLLREEWVPGAGRP